MDKKLLKESIFAAVCCVGVGLACVSYVAFLLTPEFNEVLKAVVGVGGAVCGLTAVFYLLGRKR